MSLSALIKKGGLANAATVTPATIATQLKVKAITVAPVATVIVTKETKQASVFLPDEERNILAWLAYINETDQATIGAILDQCRGDLDARRFFLKYSEEIPKPVTTGRHIACNDCIHFERIDHPHLGHCNKGEPEAIAGLWDSDQRYCAQSSPIPRQANNGCSSPIRAEEKDKFS
ncbi:MAG: hypothetical protein KUG53_01390 [Pseudomonadales bacterium]|nr:hypothetical protein [Pseudomonadales bacterium]